MSDDAVAAPVFSAGSNGAPDITPVILSGGTGTRLWPLSRTAHPKQFQPLGLGGGSLLAETIARNAHVPPFAPPVVIGHCDHRFLLAEELRRLGFEESRILLEPVGRNTGPAAVMAALWASRLRSDALVLLAPSDHHMAERGNYQAAVAVAAAAALEGAIVTFGVVPTRAETGYGYLRRGQAAWAPGCFRLERFLEKPDDATARTFLAEGTYLWNSGIFLFRADRLLDEAARLAPAMLEGCRAALADGRDDGPFLWLEQEAFSRCPAEPVDTAFMEKIDCGAVVPLEAGWNDVGSWQSLWDVTGRDSEGNAVQGDVVLQDCRGCYVWATDMLAAAIGVEDMVVVVTADAVLVCPRDQSQRVKELVAELARRGRTESTSHVVVRRPWGAFEALGHGDRFQVKRLVVEPGKRLSVQMHYHRSEHWVVVRGTARILNGAQDMLLFENQSTYIAAGTKHRLENPGLVPLELIEVQSGSYLGEDDIVRFDDDFGRMS